MLWTAKHMFLTPFLPVSCHGPGLLILCVDDTNSVWARAYPMCECACALLLLSRFSRVQLCVTP